MSREIEAKIKVDGLVEIRMRLNELGASNEGETNERNWVLDNSAGSLESRGLLLRVRNLGDAGAILTVKRPVEGGEFKVREEVETMVDSVRDLLKQLDMLGYQVKWIYEKRRQTWLWRDCVLALDECPELGFFVEIEGEPDAIRAVCEDLYLDPESHIDDNYLTLWRKYLEANGEEDRNMVFSSDAKWADDDLASLSDLLF